MAGRFRAIALNVNDITTLVYHPKIRDVKKDAEKDKEELKIDYPNLKTFQVISPVDPLWKDD
jgi:hypothetical protein